MAASHPTTRTISRRAALASAGVASLAAVAAPGLALAAHGDDAELLALIRQHQAALDYANSGLGDDDAIDAAVDVEVERYNAVMRHPAKTPAGLIAKVRVYGDTCGWCPGDLIEPGITVEERGLAAVMLDAERLFGRARS